MKILFTVSKGFYVSFKIKENPRGGLYGLHPTLQLFIITLIVISSDMIRTEAAK